MLVSAGIITKLFTKYGIVPKTNTSNHDFTILTLLYTPLAESVPFNL